MRQILYSSFSRPRGETADVGRILEQSRHNNALDGVTGLLWTDGIRFLQVLEGPEDSVEATFARISRDPRHQAIVTLFDKRVESRQFGDWAMAYRRDAEGDDGFNERVRRMLDTASQDVRHTFLGLMTTRAGVR